MVFQDTFFLFCWEPSGPPGLFHYDFLCRWDIYIFKKTNLKFPVMSVLTDQTVYIYIYIYIFFFTSRILWFYGGLWSHPCWCSARQSILTALMFWEKVIQTFASCRGSWLIIVNLKALIFWLSISDGLFVMILNSMHVNVMNLMYIYIYISLDWLAKKIHGLTALWIGTVYQPMYGWSL